MDGRGLVGDVAALSRCGHPTQHERRQHDGECGLVHLSALPLVVTTPAIGGFDSEARRLDRDLG